MKFDASYMIRGVELYAGLNSVSEAMRGFISRGCCGII